MGNYGDSVNRIVDLADQQINQNMNILHTEIDSWEKRRQTLLNSLEQEINQLIRSYNDEIVQVYKNKLNNTANFLGTEMDKSRTTGFSRRTNCDCISN
jgi:hypothetical protein